MTCQELLFHLISWGIFLYSSLLLASYILIGVYSTVEIRSYLRKNYFTDFSVLAASDQLPGISVLAPAYNEGANIVENVRSMLSIHYNVLELIVINDGSKDDSLEKLVKGYDLYRIETFINEQIPTKKVKGVYKSRNPVFHKLVVVDKENGGKSDALNVGINVAKHNYFVCIDVDCVLEQDALLKMIKPFLEETSHRVIASGGVVRIANDCVIEGGKLIEIKLPKKFLPRIQIVEYIRAFLLGRMAWSRLNGLLLISGAFGAFDKEIAIKCGGYNTKTVGEDMELIVRMRRYMEERKLRYRVTFIPDPLCWTEAPSTYKILGRQRNRWTRGTIETLRDHKVMFLNPRYHLLGLLSYPYWFFFELMAPMIEFTGLIAFIVFAYLGLVDWVTFPVLLGFIMLFGCLYSVFAIMMEVLTYNQYKNRFDLLKLIGTALLEPFLFHPFVVWSALRGYVDFIRKKHTWGEMTRQGLGVTQATPIVNSQPGKIISPPQNIMGKLLEAIDESAMYSLALAGILFAGNIIELLRDYLKFGARNNFFNVAAVSFANNLSFFLNVAIFPAAIFILLYLVHKKTARIVFFVFTVILAAIQVSLSEYFMITLVPLGADILGYSMNDIKQTAGAANISGSFVFIAMLLLAFSISLFMWLPRKLKPGKIISLSLLTIYGLAATFTTASFTESWKLEQEFDNSLALNKSYFFINSCFNSLSTDPKPKDLIIAKAEQDYVDEKNFPFLHKVDSNEVLSPFFSKSDAPPNLVFIVVEGLGSAFSNKEAYLGSFTPFLDSLSGKSLYWNNFLSSGGRTFAMLPSMFASLPFGKSGFLELGDEMPDHQSLMSELQKNGYTSNFFYGGDAHFDNMENFLKKNGVKVYDEKSFGASYKKMPATAGGYRWGYGDAEVYQKYLDVPGGSNPYCNIILTLSTHNPFRINEEATYQARFEQRMNELNFTLAQKEEHRRYADQYASILYADASVNNFLKAYAQRPDFQNTIFIITGDHRMPEIPMATRIDRYHVPLIIYSPLLTRTALFKGMGTHMDLTPELLRFLHKQYDVKLPAVATWLGYGLDTSRTCNNQLGYPLMQTKNNLQDYVQDGYLLNEDRLFKLSDNMNADEVTDAEEKKKLTSAFYTFLQKNATLTGATTLAPDSLLNK